MCVINTKVQIRSAEESEHLHSQNVSLVVRSLSYSNSFCNISWV